MTHPCVELIYHGIPRSNSHSYSCEKQKVNWIILDLITNKKEQYFNGIVQFENNVFFNCKDRLYKAIWFVTMMKKYCKKFTTNSPVNNKTLVNFDTIPTDHIQHSYNSYPCLHTYIQVKDQFGTLTIFDVYELQKIIVASLLHSDFGIPVPKTPANPYTNIPFTKQSLYLIYSKIHSLLLHPIMQEYFHTKFEVIS